MGSYHGCDRLVLAGSPGFKHWSARAWILIWVVNHCFGAPRQHLRGFQPPSGGTRPAYTRVSVLAFTENRDSRGQPGVPARATSGLIKGNHVFAALVSNRRPVDAHCWISFSWFGNSCLPRLVGS